MGFLDLFKRKPGRFVTEDAFRQNTANQMKMAPLTLAELRKHGVGESSQLKLEYFFYTNAPEKAAALTAKMQSLGYQAEDGRSASGKKEYLITGWTDPIPMSVEAVVDWSRRMCEIGYAHDCDFDGWGTNPNQ